MRNESLRIKKLARKTALRKKVQKKINIMRNNIKDVDKYRVLNNHYYSESKKFKK